MQENELSFLEGRFQESSIFYLADIFHEANKLVTEDTLHDLRLDLLSVLQQEMSNVYNRWEVSPSGNNYIVVTCNLCLLINVFGATVLIDNWLFFEGELVVKNFHWIEEDNLVTFDVHYLVCDEWEKCVCHFAHDDFFTYIVPIDKAKKLAQHNESCGVEENILDDGCGW